MKNLFIFTLLLLLITSDLSSYAQTNARIFNGELSKEVGWVVSISRKAKGNTSHRHFCGGVVIGPSWILTAGHCAEPDFNQPNNLQIRYGKNDLTQAGVVAVDGMILHNKYNIINSNFDLALLHLKTPIAVTPLEVFKEDGNLLANTPATVYGWGLTEKTFYDNIPETYLRSVEVPVVPQSICKRLLKDLYYPESMLCAGVLSSGPQKYDGKDNCYGDSGGPLVTEIRGKPQLIGIVSWGLDCASDVGYGVYSNVPSLSEWLEQPRIIPSYAVDAPVVHGPALIGRSLTCNPDLIAGDSLKEIKYRWLDSRNANVISRSRRLHLKNSLNNRKLVCEVQLVSSNASTYAYSKPTGTIKADNRTIKSRN